MKRLTAPMRLHRLTTMLKKLTTDSRFVPDYPLSRKVIRVIK